MVPSDTHGGGSAALQHRITSSRRHLPRDGNRVLGHLDHRQVQRTGLRVAPRHLGRHLIHDQLNPDAAVPITGGTVTLHTRAPITGTFADGTVSPIDTPTTCADERFNVTGKLAFDNGRTGTFAVVLTHLRTRLRSGCVTFGAVVIGTLTLTASANT